MATRLFGLSIQEEWRSVAAGAGAALAADDVEITIADTLTKEQAVLLIEKIRNYIEQNGVN